MDLGKAQLNNSWERRRLAESIWTCLGCPQALAGLLVFISLGGCHCHWFLNTTFLALVVYFCSTGDFFNLLLYASGAASAA